MQNNRLLLEKYEQVQVNRVLQDSFQRDLTAFEQYLIQEGLWDTIKQKGSQLVGGAKNALLQPLVKMVLDKIAQSDPEGFKQLQAAAQDPQKLQALLNSPEIQQQQQAISQDVATTTESIDEELYELYLNEAYGHLVPEAWVDPKTGRFVKAGTPGAVERKGASQRDARGRFVKGATPPATQEPPVIQGPGAFLNPGQHGSTAAYAAAQGKKVAQRIPQQTLGQKIAGTADKAAIAGLKGLGKASNLIGKGAQALGQSKLGQAAGGFVGKAVNWIKKNPKISLAAGLALLAATGGAAAIGAGGIAPLITSTLSAGAAGATKGGIAGAAFGGIKNLAQQAQDAKSLKDINWKQAGKEALKKGAVGAAIGGAVGAGANVLGKAAAGVGKVINRYQAGTSGGGASTTAPTSQASNNPSADAPRGTSADKGIRPDGSFSAAYVRQAQPDAEKILEILKNPESGVKYIPKWQDPESFAYKSGNEILNLRRDYKINGIELEDILNAGHGRNSNMALHSLYKLKHLMQKDPDAALKLLSAKIGKGLALIDAETLPK